jgi:hypothetical protein
LRLAEIGSGFLSSGGQTLDLPGTLDIIETKRYQLNNQLSIICDGGAEGFGTNPMVPIQVSTDIEI